MTCLRLQLPPAGNKRLRAVTCPLYKQGHRESSKVRFTSARTREGENAL